MVKNGIVKHVIRSDRVAGDMSNLIAIFNLQFTTGSEDPFTHYRHVMYLVLSTDG